MTCIFLKRKFIHIIILLSLQFVIQRGFSQKLDTLKERVKTDLKIAMPYIGTVMSRTANEIGESNWMIGCETLDRDFADYDQYKEFLVPLGIKLLRMQAGWNKTENVKGQYDWAWLDHIINDAVNRGLKPWLQTSYGNMLYKDGGGANLGAGMPTSKEALDGYYKWVSVMVTRYKDKVRDWEVWNEPNFGDNIVNTPEMCAELNIHTAEIIKQIQPDAKISGLALGHYNGNFVDRFFKFIGEKGKMSLFDNMTYHDYCYNPDANYHEVYLIRTSLDRYASRMKLRQGENGAPSIGGAGRGALGDYEWTELTQGKWDIRRMLGNLGHDIECSIFSIIDMNNFSGPIKRLNVKGLLMSDSTKQVIRPKIAYYAVQNVASIFDHTLERLKALEVTHNLASAGSRDFKFTKSTDRSLSVYGYQNRITKKQVYTIWMDEGIPAESNNTKNLEFSFSNGNFEIPVFVDVLTGGVYEIPANRWSKKGNVFTFKGIPVYDSPILIADKSLIKINQNLFYCNE